MSNLQLYDMPANTVKGNGTAATGAGVDNVSPRDLALDPTLVATNDTGRGGTLKVADGKIGATQLTDGGVTREKIEKQVALSVLGNPEKTLDAPPEQIVLDGFTITGVTVASQTRSRDSSNVAKIITTAAHGLVTDDLVNVTAGPTGTPDATFYAVHVKITKVDATTFTYPNTGAVVTDGASGNLVVRKIGLAKLKASGPAVGVAVAYTATVQGVAPAYLPANPLPLWGGSDMAIFKDGAADFSCVITPTKGTNSLLVEVSAPVSHAGTGNYEACLALFRDPVAGTTALAIAPIHIQQNLFNFAQLRFVLPVGTAGVTTFKLKYAGSQTTFNGKGGNAAWAPQAIITVTEFSP